MQGPISAGVRDRPGKAAVAEGIPRWPSGSAEGGAPLSGTFGAGVPWGAKLHLARIELATFSVLG